MSQLNVSSLVSHCYRRPCWRRHRRRPQRCSRRRSPRGRRHRRSRRRVVQQRQSPQMSRGAVQARSLRSRPPSSQVSVRRCIDDVVAADSAAVAIRRRTRRSCPRRRRSRRPSCSRSRSPQSATLQSASQRRALAAVIAGLAAVCLRSSRHRTPPRVQFASQVALGRPVVAGLARQRIQRRVAANRRAAVRIAGRALVAVVAGLARSHVRRAVAHSDTAVQSTSQIAVSPPSSQVSPAR